MDSSYLKKFAISQSSIKDWKDLSPLEWYETWVTRTRTRPRKPSTSFGSYLDCLCFTPKAEEKRFVIATVPQPSEKVTKILQDLYDHVEELNKRAQEFNASPECKTPIPIKEHTLDDQELVNKFTEENEHYKGKLKQAYNDVVKKGTEYFEFLKSTAGRTVISKGDRDEALEMKDILFNHKTSKGFFVPKAGCDVVFQQYIFAEFDVDFENVQIIPVKGAVDILHFNHKRKEVREVDLKCTDNAYLFDGPQGPVRRFDYIAQHSFYDYLIKEWLKTYKDGEFKDYSVMNPLNVVIDRKQRLPYLYEYTQHDLYVKRYGIENTKIRGWEDTINEIAFHLDCGDWTYPMEHIKNGKIVISAFTRR